jgi:nitrite reductase/ring-hydroxylating ferredoxin subunit
MRIFCFALLASGLLAACNSGVDSSSSVPSVPVNVQLDLIDQQNRALRFDNGAVAVAGGVKGILVIRQNANTYLAFERNCPYQPYNACAYISVDRSRLFLRDTCCSSQFNLQGQVTSGPATRALRQYNTNLSGSLLTITN